MKNLQISTKVLFVVAATRWLRKVSSFIPHSNAKHFLHERLNQSTTKQILPTRNAKLAQTLHMVLLPIDKDDLGQIITKRLPTPAQYATYWGRTSREQYNAAFEAFGVSFLGVFGAYFLSFAVGQFVATIFGTIAAFWFLLAPEFKAYQRNWELTGGRELVDPWTEEDYFDYNEEDKRGLYGAFYFGRISHVSVVEDPTDSPDAEYSLDDFEGYSMEKDELEKLTGEPYLLRFRVTDDEKDDYGSNGRELQIHTRMSEEYLSLEIGMPVCSILLSSSQKFEYLAALTDFCIPDAGPCWVGDYPYIDRPILENILIKDDDLWNSLQNEGRGQWDVDDWED
mmetsp:Transcript_3751/g.5607  ORF Transcript_3751/g.5607 Transcript_3751/m.5607 type:complete len:339 (-) Transcript_3751:278-1294(-)